MIQQKTTLHLDLTAAQKAQIWAATGREVNALELRLQGGLEPATGPEGAVEPEIPAGPDQEPAPEPAVIRRECDGSGR
jgi:hypothetical protein